MNPVIRVELIAIGDELQSGRTVDTNSAFLGRRLTAAGLPVHRRTVIGDDPAVIGETLKLALDRSRLIFVVGGLGPTPDDRTTATVAEVLGRKLVTHPPTLRRIEARFRRAGRKVPPAVKRQARVLAGARLFANPVGTAPGCLLERQNTILVLLPGVPAELEALFDVIEPFLRQRFLKSPIHRVQVRTTGRPESALAPVVERSLRRFSGVSTAYYPSTSGVDVVLTASSEPEMELALGAARKAIGTSVYEIGNRGLPELVGDLLRSRRLHLATAESCTGGMIASRITDVPGSSDYFKGGSVVYANEAKLALLGVAETSLYRHGAVSMQVVRELALGACRMFQAEVGIAVSGIAGPGGGTPAKPVGLVYVAVALNEQVWTERFLFNGPRRSVREQATAAALDLCRRCLSDPVRPRSTGRRA